MHQRPGLRAPRIFLRDQRGLSGAEKALMVCFGLAIVILVGVLVRSGGEQAGGDAQKVLAVGMGSQGAMGQLMVPGRIAHADAVAPAGPVAAPSSPQAPVPTPAPAPAPKFTGAAPPATIGNFRELAQFVFSRYGTGEPIGIVKLNGFAQPTYLVVLSGTEPRPGQTTWIPEDIWSAFNASDKYRENILAAMQAHGIPQGAQIVVAGHSLGGMEAQNLVTDPAFRARYTPNSVVTFGSPITASQVPGVQYARFQAYGDAVPRTSPRGLANVIGRAELTPFAYALKWGSFGYFNWTPPTDQTMVGPYQATWSPTFAPHSTYPNLPDLNNYPLNGPNGQPLQLDTGDYGTYKAQNPRGWWP